VDNVSGNDHANGGPGIDRFERDPGDVLVSAERPGSCAGD
jgi:hypothetical protein